MEAFYGKESIKKKYVKRLIAHHKADQIIQREMWDQKNNRGCAVGCTLDKYDHKAYETELGIPEWLAKVEDRIFEGLPNKAAPDFARDFLEAVNVGSDLEMIKGPFLIIILKSALKSFDHEKYQKVKESIERVISLWKKGGAQEEFRSARAAAAAADAAAADAADAAYAAADAADAADAAYAAYAAAAYAAAAADAADAAADAAAADAYAAAADAYADAADAAYAREKTYLYFAKELLKLIRKCK